MAKTAIAFISKMAMIRFLHDDWHASEAEYKIIGQAAIVLEHDAQYTPEYFKRNGWVYEAKAI